MKWWRNVVSIISAKVHFHFEQGLVDSDTLPLNVSREMLQQHSSLKTIKKKLIRKALDMIRKIAEEDPDESNDKENKGECSCFFWVLENSFICCFRQST